MLLVLFVHHNPVLVLEHTIVARVDIVWILDKVMESKPLVIRSLDQGKWFAYGRYIVQGSSIPGNYES